MKDRARDLTEKADEFRGSNELRKAGNFYTAAAYEYAGTVSEHSFPDPDYTRSALGELLKATTCYRIVGDEFRTQNRCELGTVLAEDYAEFSRNQEFDENSFANLRRGAWPEFIGDLRTIAERDDADEAYDRAKEIYESAGYWEFVLKEWEHIRLSSYFRLVREGLGHDIPRDAPEVHGMDMTFTDWLEYKRERLPDMLDELEAQGTWPVEP